MATRGRLGILLDDGSVLSVYHHWDSYPEGLGAKLVKSFNNKEKVAELIDGGDISTCMATRDWNGVETGGETILYYSDRGDKDVDPRVSDNLESYLEESRENWAEYAYLFDTKTNEWSCFDLNAIAEVPLYSPV